MAAPLQAVSASAVAENSFFMRSPDPCPRSTVGHDRPYQAGAANSVATGPQHRKNARAARPFERFGRMLSCAGNLAASCLRDLPKSRVLEAAAPMPSAGLDPEISPALSEGEGHA